MGIEEKVGLIKDFTDWLVFLMNAEKLCIAFFFFLIFIFFETSQYIQWH